MRQLKFAKPAGACWDPSSVELPVELDESDISIIEYVRSNHLSMVGDRALFATLLACKYVCEAGIRGDFVECGVWRGGNSIIAAEIFRRFSDDRKVILFDTFAGMTAPSSVDTTIRGGRPAQPQFTKAEKDGFNEWCFADQASVEKNFHARGLRENVQFIKGDVRETLAIESNIPERISVLRLDTDWYESTRLELENLWPRLEEGGVLIIDDYGFWSGARKAVDEFFKTQCRPFFHCVNKNCRAAVKFSLDRRA